MGVLDDAIREHLDLKKRRGASDEEIARAEAEALTPARRPPPVGQVDVDDLERDSGEAQPEAAGPLRIEPVDDVAPPPEPTRAVHDIDEDPMPAPAHGHESDRGQETVEADVLDLPSEDESPRDSGRLSD
jgi:hypothetical protein